MVIHTTEKNKVGKGMDIGGDGGESAILVAKEGLPGKWTTEQRAG